jgi:hypothetical protein
MSAPSHENSSHATVVTLTAKEIQTLMAAMAGNHPATLSEHRMPVLRKLARAAHELKAK